MKTLEVPGRETSESMAALGPDFAQRLEGALEGADRERRRQLWLDRVRLLLPAVLLIGPFVGWRLMLTSPDGVHVSIQALAWLALFLDVGVHLDSAMLSYLHLQLLPTIAGFLLFVLIAMTLLGYGTSDDHT